MIKFNKHLLFIFLTLTLTACGSSDKSGPDLDGDGIEDSVDTDIDGDGVANELDAFPLDASESLDTDGDGIGDNTDDSLNFTSNINNGPLKDAQSWVYSLDGKYSYLGTYQGLLINTLDENGSFTEDTQFVSSDDLGIDFDIDSSLYLEISSKGFLYWAGRVQSDENVDNSENDGFIAKLTLDQNSGDISTSQFVRFTSVANVDEPGSPEMFVLSPNEDKLYVSVHYADLKNSILTFDLDTTSGNLTYVGQFALGSNYPAYEHNMAVSSDGNFLYYGDYSLSASLFIMPLNDETKEPESFTVQNIEFDTGNVEYSNLIIKSILGDKLILATSAHLGIYSYSSTDGTLTEESKINFTTPISTPITLAISEDEGHIALLRSELTGNYQLNTFTLDNSNNLALINTESGLDVSTDLRFNKNLISLIGYRTDSVYEYSLLNSTLTEVNPFNSFYTMGANITSVEDEALSFVNTNNEFVRIATNSGSPIITSKQKLNVLVYATSKTLISLTDTIIQFSSGYDTNLSSVTTEYVIANVSDTGELNQTSYTLYTGQERIFKAYAVGDYIVTLEEDADGEYFVGLYKLVNNQLEFIESPLTTVDYLTYYNNMETTDTGILLDGDEYIVVDEQLILNTDYTGVSYNGIELIGGSISVDFSEQMLIVANAAGDELSNTVLDTFDYAHKLDDERILLVSNVTSNEFNFAIYSFNSDGTFAMQSQGDYQVTASDTTTVDVELSDTGNTAWLLVNGGYYDIGYLNLDL
jgi:hypothetical protein